MLPAHLQALLSAHVAPPAQVIPARDKTPVFAPVGGVSPRSSSVRPMRLQRAVEDMGELECFENENAFSQCAD